MSDRPLVSVIVPVYNGARFLPEALASIAAQVYTPLQLLVVDDGSTDESAAVAAAFAGVTVLRKPHSGVDATLNYGLRHAEGELIAFLDADDRWLPGKLAAQVAMLARHPEVDVVFAHMRQFVMGEDAAGGGDRYSPPQPGYGASTLLARRSVFARVGAFDEAQGVHHFLSWYARVQDAGLQVRLLPEVLAERRIHDHNYGRTHAVEQRVRYLGALRAVVQQRRQSGQADARDQDHDR